jgi:glutamate-ammonia-ligase adenylyltransferase
MRSDDEARPGDSHAAAALARWMRGDEGVAAPSSSDGGLLARATRALASRFPGHIDAVAEALCATPAPGLAANRLLDVGEPGSLLDDAPWLARFCLIASQSAFLGRAAARAPELARPGGSLGEARLARLEQAAQDDTIDDAAFGALHRDARIAWMSETLVGEATGAVDVLDSASRVAEHASRSIDAALVRAHEDVADGPRLRLCVLGMGKLGSGELNPSSDIDLIVLYDPIEARDDDADRTARIVRRMTTLLEARDSGAPVLRVDHRLRPFGSQGALAWRRDHALQYYERHGRAWERLAMLRARPVAGALDVGESFLARLRPFVFRRSLDPAALTDIAAMKASIDSERRRRDALRDNPRFDVKLGEGGIREVEFLVQALLLVWGGRLGETYAPATGPSLGRLVAHGLLPERDARELLDAYRWLRLVEHRIQLDEDRQDHRLPDGDRLDLLARRLGCGGTAGLEERMAQHTSRVHAAWQALFGDAEWSGVDAGVAWAAAVAGRVAAEDLEGAMDIFARRGFRAPSRAAAAVGRLLVAGEPLLGPHASSSSRRVGERLLDLCAHTPLPDVALDRLAELLRGEAARTTVQGVCARDPRAAQLLVSLLSASEPVARLLGRDPRALEPLVTRPWSGPDETGADAELAVLRTQPRRDGEAPGVELRLDRMRRWAGVRQARHAMALLGSTADVRTVTRRLSDDADALLRATRAEALGQLGLPEDYGLGVLALGKLGGVELGFAADLDVVFVCADDEDRARAAAVARRWMSYLSAPLRYGRLFEVDARLRPDGNAGPLVTSVDGLREYHLRRAWGFEHVALWRGRAVAGPPALAAAIEGVVADVLGACDVDRAVASVWEVRDRRVAQAPVDGFKSVPGGLMDLELWLHTKALRAWRDEGWSGTRPRNAWATLGALRDNGRLRAEQAERLGRALDFYRRLECWARLSDGRGEERLPRDHRLVGIEARVLGAGEDGSALRAALAEARATVRETLENG